MNKSIVDNKCKNEKHRQEMDLPYEQQTQWGFGGENRYTPITRLPKKWEDAVPYMTQARLARASWLAKGT